MVRRFPWWCLTASVVVATTMTGCMTAKERRPFLYFIFDASGSFQRWLPQARETACHILEKVMVNPGAQVCVAVIDDHSYPSDNVLLGPVKMPDNPLEFKRQRRMLLDEFAKLEVPVSSAPGTDIQGALHRAAEYAAANPSDWLDLLIFCDMQEEHNPIQYQPVRFSVPVRLTVFFMPQLKIVSRDAYGRRYQRDETKQEFMARQEKWRMIFAQYGVPTARYAKFYDPSQSRVTGGLASTSIEAVVAELSKAPEFAPAGPQQMAGPGGPGMPMPGPGYGGPPAMPGGPPGPGYGGPPGPGYGGPGPVPYGGPPQPEASGPPGPGPGQPPAVPEGPAEPGALAPPAS
ncbi:MAG: hypothetical protein N2512_08945 [Armatimonadetes bacterium]|nr:hypothetical protein [Armatimonadota bacterium]